MQRFFMFLALTLLLTARLLAATADDAVAAATVAIDDGDYQAAKASLERLERQHPGRAVVAFELGRALYLEGDSKEAAEWLEVAVDRGPSVSAHHQWLGRAYAELAQEANVFRKVSLAGKSRDAFEKAVELDGDNIDARLDLIEYYLEAPGILGGSVERAQEQAAKIVERDPYQGHRARGRIYRHEEQYAEAEKAYLAAIEVEGDDPVARFQLGYLYQELERWDQAFATFGALSELDSEKMLAYYQIGRTGALSGTHLERAAEAMTLYLEHQPADHEPSLAWAHFRLGGVYQQMGEKAKAKREYQVALALEADHEQAQKALKKLR